MLTTTELKALERDFVLLLASQGLSADLWQQYVSSGAPQVDEAIVDFSDIVLERIYMQCRLVELITANGWLFYHFNDETSTIEMRGITITDDSSMDLRDLDLNKAIKMTEEAPEGTFRLIRAEKPIKSSKPREVHELLTRGGFISENLKIYELLLTFS
jgi:hypothetical protein